MMREYLERSLFLIVAVLVHLQSPCRAPAAHIQDDVANDITGQRKGRSYVNCQCGGPENSKRRQIDMTLAENLFKAIIVSDNASVDEIQELAVLQDFIENCRTCRIDITKCNGKKLSMKENDCKKKLLEFELYEDSENSLMPGKRSKMVKKRSIQEFPKFVAIPIGGTKNGSHRQIRRADACPFPAAMKTAAISCRVYPNIVKCIQQCSFGHRLEDGIEQGKECSKEENKWIPSGFHECKPFIDCTMTLAFPGKMNCTTATLDRGPECNVECLRYEDKDDVPMNTYSCNIDGEWDPPLPHCVIAGSGLVLMAPPEKRLHSESFE